MTTTATKYRLRELHKLFLSEFERRAWFNATHILLEIGKEAKIAGLKVDPDAPTVSGEVRAEYWRSIFDRLRGNNQIIDALDIAKMWAKDREAA